MITTIVLSPAIDKIYFVDNFEAGKLYRVDNGLKWAGGKGINVARVASILGEKVASAGFKAGSAGEWLENELIKLGVQTHFIEVHGESRTNSNIIDRAKGTETEILEAGPRIGGDEAESFLQCFRELLDYTDILVCSGGLPLGIPVDFYRTLVEEASARNVRVILDSSNEMLEEGIKGKPYIIKPNLRELSRLAGRKPDGLEQVREACLEVIEKGVHAVAASLGKDGALLVTEDAAVHAAGPEVEVVNTIGSGDSMVAGIAAGLERGWDLERAFVLGMACATANTQFQEIGYVTCELVEKYMKEIRLRVL